MKPMTDQEFVHHLVTFFNVTRTAKITRASDICLRRVKKQQP